MDLVKKIFVGVSIGVISIGIPAFGGWMWRMEQIGTQLLEQNKASIRRHETNERVQADHESRIRYLERNKPAQGFSAQ